MSLVTRFSKKAGKELSGAKFVAADTLSGDVDSSDKPDSIEHRSAPQISEHSDTNPSPNNQQTQQDAGHGEPDLGISQAVIGDEKKGTPEQGEDNPGRHELLRNFPADRTAQELSSNQSWWNRIWQGKTSFDGFVEMLGDGEYLTQAHLNAMNPTLLQTLRGAGAIGTEAIFKVDKNRIKKIVNELRNNNIDLSQVNVETINKYLQKTYPTVRDINKPTWQIQDKRQNPDEWKSLEDNIPGQKVMDEKVKGVLGSIPANVRKMPLLQMIPAETRNIGGADMRVDFIFDMIKRYQPKMTVSEFATLSTQTLKGWWDQDSAKTNARLLPKITAQTDIEPMAMEQYFEQIRSRAKGNEVTEVDKRWLEDSGLMKKFQEWNNTKQQAPIQQEQQVSNQKNVFPFTDGELENFKHNILSIILERSVTRYLQDVGGDLPNMPKHGSRKMSRLTLEEVRKMSPKMAARMQKFGIEWVEEKSFMKALADFNNTQIKVASDPTMFTYYWRRRGVALNDIKREIAAKLARKEITQEKHDLSLVFMDRMAELDMHGELSNFAQLKAETSKYVDMSAATKLQPISEFLKTSAKNVLAKDYTLYHMDMGTNLDRFNYNDSMDIEWTLYKQTKEGKKGDKVDVYPSPGRCLYRVIDHGDGEYLCVGMTKLDESYWGTYSVKVVNGIVVQYAKVPVDKEGKRFANLQIDKALDAQRKRYIAMYKAVKKVAQVGPQRPAYEDFPADDEEWDRRIKQMQEYEKKMNEGYQQSRDKLKDLKTLKDINKPTLEPKELTQEEIDKAYEEKLQKMQQENPDLWK